MKKIKLLILLGLTTHIINAQADAFVATWKTTGVNEIITLGSQSDAPNYTINWGDGGTNSYTANQTPSHTYVSIGDHTVSFTGTFTHLDFSNQTKLIAVQQWGTHQWKSMARMFYKCSSLNSIPTQAPDLTLCTDMSYMFYSATSFNQPIDNWNVSKVNDMKGMFSSATSFNQPIGSWNVGNVLNMTYMFSIARSFNQPIDNWNMSKVTNMSSMFELATSFNQPIDNWNVSNVTNMSSLFSYTTSFNQPLGSWNIGNVSNMNYMFNNAKLSLVNYDNLLKGWASKGVLQQGVTFSGGNSKYCSGSVSRKFLIDTYGWIISDGGANCPPIAVADSITVLQGGTTYSLDNDNNHTIIASVTSYTNASGETITTLIGGGSSVLTNDTDAENNSLKAILVTKPINGAFALNSDGKFVYIHNGSKTTKDSFTYKANDGTSDSNTVTVNINITPVNSSPIAVADSITVLQGGTSTTLVSKDISILTNDTDAENNTLTATVVTNPVNGKLTLNGNGTFIYVHNGSQTTTDSFTYKANDGTSNSSSVTVSIIIVPFTLLFNNFSIETKSETCSGKNNGEIIINATQSLNYTTKINNINYNFVNNSLTVTNLTPGVYNACIEVSGLVFKQCFTLTIAKGGSITGKLSNTSNNKVAVEITEGTAPFEILVNGKSQFETNQTIFSVDVNQGDLIEVKTAISCEGIYSKAIMDAPIGISAFPNPTSGEFEIQVPEIKDEIYIELFSINSILILRGIYPVVNQKVKLSLENQSHGIYIAKVHSKTPISLIIIKE